MAETITRPASRYRQRLTRRFRNITNVGVFNCRKVAGSDTWSQHAWGNALDIMGGQTTLEKVARFSAKRFRAKRYRIHQVIFRERVWTPRGGWQHYNGVPHVTHVHVDFNPIRTGTPPCAT